MPQGADTVFMQEDVRVEGGAVDRAAGLEARRQPPARRRGCARGVGRAAGRPAAAAAGSEHGGGARACTTLPVRRRVRVAIFSTGDEIVEPGAPLPAAGLYDANR